MSKSDQILRDFGARIGESASRRPAPISMPPAGAEASPGGDRLDGTTRMGKSALFIALDRIERDPTQPREEFDEEALNRLAQSIRFRGVLQPIRVRFDQGGGVYRIVAGERRWRAAKMAGLAELPCIDDDRPLTSADILTDQVIENALREDLKPVERAKAYAKLVEIHGWTYDRLAKELGIANSAVTQALDVLDLCPPVQAAVDAGTVPASVAITTKGLPAEEQEQIAADYKAGKLRNRDEVKAEVKAAKARAGKKAGKPKARPLPTRREFRAPGGAKVTIERAKGLDFVAILAAAEHVAAEMRAKVEEQGRGIEAA